MRITATIALCGLIALPVQAAEMKVEVNIPRLNVAEYHRPYVAIWVEGQDQTARANLAAALYTHGAITTTETKAKRLRPLAERLVTFAKRGDLHARRRVLSVIGDKEVVHVLFAEIAPLVADR